MKFHDQLSELVILAREQNGLLRELLVALGRQPQTPRSNASPVRQFTRDDVTVVTKARREQMAQDNQPQPPWRWTQDGGPDSETTSPSEPSKSNAAVGKPTSNGPTSG